MGLWWQCIPTIKAVFTSPGVMEVFWDPPPEEAKQFIRGYNVRQLCLCHVICHTQSISVEVNMFNHVVLTVIYSRDLCTSSWGQQIPKDAVNTLKYV